MRSRTWSWTHSPSETGWTHGRWRYPPGDRRSHWTRMTCTTNESMSPPGTKLPIPECPLNGRYGDGKQTWHGWGNIDAKTLSGHGTNRVVYARKSVPRAPAKAR